MYDHGRFSALCIISLILFFLFSCKSDSIKKTRLVNNSFCLVCHLNYNDEPLAKNHLSAEIGCIKCHGPSLAHAGDENAVIAPDKIFPKKKINGACMECHDRDSIDTSCMHDPTEKHGACTDCHGKHRLIERERKWDKETKKLICPALEDLGM